MAGQDAEQLKAANDALGERVESMLSAFEQQTQQLAGLRDSLESIKAEGWSADKLVRVTANAGGIPIDVWIAPEAFKRSTPDRLSQSVAEASQHAARAAQDEAAAAVAPITDVADSMPDITDLTPGAPSVRGIFDSFIPKPADRVPSNDVTPEPVDTEDMGSVNWLKDER
ncbi:YbaB/EbfC family nucleoid-associated protein [Rhodococcus sp. NPDC058521]|uniref:YbaB/EbfC family nucleoid-associated protein n=1 Tax=Rhodococcus sp. NPDC058521 TaxID=3346536 RepID=UPI0036481729